MDDQKTLQAFQERLDGNYNAFMQGWLKLDTPDLVEKAQEIAATQTVYTALRGGHVHLENIEYLLRFRNPLEVVRDQWMEEEFSVPDRELEHAIWAIVDRGDAVQNYELDEAFHPPERGGMKLC
ncbi:MAG: DUF3848 domain-containing protein [Ethanoligenens sp.]